MSEVHVIPGDKPYLWDLVLADLAVRDEHGDRRYGNMFGCDLEAEYQAAIDKVFALRRRLFQRDGK